MGLSEQRRPFAEVAISLFLNRINDYPQTL
jgi:hypothetical protein